MRDFHKKVKVKPLTLTELHQLRGYCLNVEEDGGYYGNKKQYWKRHENIVVFLEDLIYKLEESK